MQALKRKNSLPNGTETEAWRVMSAKIAWALWSNTARLSQPIERNSPADRWPELASDYRARVRATLRQLALEGTMFKEGPLLAANDRLSQEWWEKSARLSWLLWLRTRRSESVANQSLEAIYWRNEAESYRDYVRSVLRELREQGIHLDV